MEYYIHVQPTLPLHFETTDVAAQGTCTGCHTELLLERRPSREGAMGDSATKIAGVLVCSGAGSGFADVIFLHLELMTPLNR